MINGREYDLRYVLGRCSLDDYEKVDFIRIEIPIHKIGVFKKIKKK